MEAAFFRPCVGRLVEFIVVLLEYWRANVQLSENYCLAVGFWKALFIIASNFFEFGIRYLLAQFVYYSFQAIFRSNHLQENLCVA